MKRFIHLLPVALLLVSASLNAQQVFVNENFEAGSGTTLPSGWTQTTNASDGGFNIGSAAALSSSAWVIPTHTNVIATNDDGCNCDKSVDYLYSPVIDLSAATSAILSLDVFYQDGSYQSVQEDAKIEVTVDGSSYTELMDIAGSTSWRTVEIDLSSYVGYATVKLRFKYSDNGGYVYGLALDNIKVYQPAENDIAVTSINVAPYVAAGFYTVSGTVKNTGSEPITYFQVDWTTDGGTISYTDRVSGVSIPSLGSYNFTHNIDVDAFNPGVYNLKVTALVPNQTADGDTSNNAQSASFVSLTAIPDKNVLIEEYTGAWCQYCPDGAVILEDILNTTPNAIGVSIHDNDGMAFTAGNTIIAQYASGFPAGTVDRFNFEDLGGVELNRGIWEDAVNERLDDVSPVAVSSVNTYNAATRALSVTVTAEFFASFTGDYRMSLMVVEDSVSGSGNQYDQVNAFNTVSGHPYQGAGNPIVGFQHMNVLRTILGGAWGQTGIIPSSVQANTPYTYTFTTTIPQTWDTTQLKLVAVVQKYNADANDRAVLNAVQSDLNDSVANAFMLAPDYGVGIILVNNAGSGGSNGSATATGVGIGPFTYVWSNGDTSATATGLSPGTYTVTMTDNSGQTSTTSVTVYENNEVGINETAADQLAMNVYPNPTSGQITLAVDLGANKGAKVEIFNLVGTKVYERNLGAFSSVNLTVDMGGYASGMYLVKLTAGEKTVVSKVQVNK
jgi:hypothetical protein